MWVFRHKLNSILLQYGHERFRKGCSEFLEPCDSTACFENKTKQMTVGLKIFKELQGALFMGKYHSHPTWSELV